MNAILNLGSSFLAGLAAPIGAVCVLPLYPGFLAYLANQGDKKRNVVVLGLVVTIGVIISMGLFGLIITFFLQESLTKAIGIISPIAFALLALISILMIFDVDFTRFLPKKNAKVYKNPYLSSFLFGAFFGAIVLPCNPASLVVLFAISTTTTSAALNLAGFILFGVGMATPLLIFAIISKADKVIAWLTEKKRIINVTAGLIMLSISLYYLFFVFKVHQLVP